jgi:hypothetical protein
MAEIAILMGLSSAKDKEEESEAPPLAEKPALICAHVRSVLQRVVYGQPPIRWPVSSVLILSCSGEAEAG